MTVSNTYIWKSVSASTRPASRTGDKNIHIGQTLKDLYFNGETPTTDGRLQDLLDALDTSEGKPEPH